MLSITIYQRVLSSLRYFYSFYFELLCVNFVGNVGKFVRFGENLNKFIVYLLKRHDKNSCFLFFLLKIYLINRKNSVHIRLFGCQYWQDPASIWQEMVNYAKPQLKLNLPKMDFHFTMGLSLNRIEISFNSVNSANSENLRKSLKHELGSSLLAVSL